MLTVHVPVSNAYDVLIGNGIRSQLAGHIERLLPKSKKLAIITDDTVKGLYLSELKVAFPQKDIFTYSIPPGEASKNSDNYVNLLSWLAENTLTGTDAIIALGGGVVGDLAGFVAATYLRGIPYIQIPTTLLAMVDSSVGGKTAIDLPEGKNLVGAFYQPKLVLCDTDFLETLPENILNDGYSEVIKYGMLGNAKLLDDLLHGRIGINEIVATCVTMKKDIVIQDEFDKGVRKLLNFGHTIGHAIEQISHYHISHGQGVAIGMALDTKAAVANGQCDPQCLDILESLLTKYKLPSKSSYTADDIYEAATRDKKREGDYLTNIVPTQKGRCQMQNITMQELHQWIKKGVTL